MAVPPHALKAARDLRYNRRVFILPHWPEIFTQDAERRQDEAEAEATFSAMAQTYAELGYELVEVPHAAVEARADFVAAAIRR